ncbi:hypothetical protein KFK09_025129 [Dendrobium nobile]|uniref:Uncharacterized protein n=1 Tax=Dendrobium nobile TaxID=94219 RepID=A0A8T3AFQ4_DENNO|nr:hypothetical protein KFK09_025129 [Dendrobium nobile]
MKWSQTLGEIKDIWGALTMKLIVEGRKVVIRGDAWLSKAMVALKTIVRSLQEVREDYLVGLHKLDVTRMERGDVSRSVQLNTIRFFNHLKDGHLCGNTSIFSL